MLPAVVWDVRPARPFLDEDHAPQEELEGEESQQHKQRGYCRAWHGWIGLLQAASENSHKRYYPRHNDEPAVVSVEGD